jgi:predicted metal-dependent hydrolase
MIAYRAATENRRKLSATGLLAEMMLLWNQGLFFEVHELLENHWHEAQGEWREVLKTLIQAAAVYVHREAGRLEAAGKMGRRVSGRLDELRVHLKPIANLDVLRRALENPEGRSPRLEEHRR